MKKYCKIMGSILVALFLLTSSAMAATVYYADTTVYWPGYASGISSWDVEPPGDEVGNPQISGLSITMNDNSMLTNITVYQTNRLADSTLFINSGGVTGNWNYVVDWTLVNGVAGYYLFAVNDPTNFTYTMAYDGRPNHPNGISAADLTAILGLASIDITSTYISYNFDGTIAMSRGFQVGYTPYCANDVILTPEPSILMLLGIGLIGLAGLRRRFQN